MTDDAKQKREAVLPPCPFCGAHPHHGLSKVMYDGLHGDPYQRFQVWCPNGHAKVDKVNREQAFTAWKACQPQTDALAILTAIREPSEAMKEKGFAAYYDTQIPQHPIIAAFTAMIDEAFKEQSK
jgi:hypothetical protein